MLIGNRSKFIDYWSRANTGPICFEDDFDKKIYWPKLKEITKRWEIVYDPKHQVPTDDDMLDRLWQAAIDMVVEVGVLCVDTRRIMHFTRKEIEDTVANCNDTWTVEPHRNLRPAHRARFPLGNVRRNVVRRPGQGRVPPGLPSRPR